MHKSHRRSRFSFTDISRLTATEDAAIVFAEQLRWPSGISCHRCDSTNITHLSERRGRYRCRTCARQFSIRTGTPMECSRLPISTWLRGLWLIISSSKGISSLKLAEMLGIQQKSAWFLAHRVRAMMAWVVPHPPISGSIVELDEVYAGAKPRQKSGGGPTGVKSGRGPRRPLVLTAAVRGGEVRFRQIKSHGKSDIGSAADARMTELSLVSKPKRGKSGHREMAPDPRLTNPYWSSRLFAEGDRRSSGASVARTGGAQHSLLLKGKSDGPPRNNVDAAFAVAT